MTRYNIAITGRRRLDGASCLARQQKSRPLRAGFRRLTRRPPKGRHWHEATPSQTGCAHAASVAVSSSDSPCGPTWVGASPSLRKAGSKATGESAGSWIRSGAVGVAAMPDFVASSQLTSLADEDRAARLYSHIPAFLAGSESCFQTFLRVSQEERCTSSRLVGRQHIGAPG
jgi:hypothetical protein